MSNTAGYAAEYAIRVFCSAAEYAILQDELLMCDPAEYAAAYAVRIRRIQNTCYNRIRS